MAAILVLDLLPTQWGPNTHGNWGPGIAGGEIGGFCVLGSSIGVSLPVTSVGNFTETYSVNGKKLFTIQNPA